MKICKKEEEGEKGQFTREIYSRERDAIFPVIKHKQNHDLLI